MIKIHTGDCVTVPDGQIGRVRLVEGNKVKVRLMRTTSHTHHFLRYQQFEVKIVACPKGWMSPEGYNKYLKVTLEKMQKRNAIKTHEKRGKNNTF